MHTVIVVPSRYGSSVFPGKARADILGKPIVRQVYARDSAVECADQVVLATDDQRVLDALSLLGGSVVRTSPEHISRIDHLVEVMDKAFADFYMFVQGDESLGRPKPSSSAVMNRLAQ